VKDAPSHRRGALQAPGFYAYRKTALDTFHHLAPSPLELTEKLEQVSFLENEIDIVVETTEPFRPSPRSWPGEVKRCNGRSRDGRVC
jgi:CMP-2-keto-3-deoxyoctulosonic acid synthetase